MGRTFLVVALCLGAFVWVLLGVSSVMDYMAALHRGADPSFFARSGFSIFMLALACAFLGGRLSAR